ncbi:XRE family transcriptional regulator [Luteimonas kalidii]|uniref:XRE family transcriptional regulator n=1 Tax=Luteimonas kalidii TaxID=3042025 RepID=A0ABT6JXE6_9GAMM|nr:XRE family transcriptional regulator [Luteimonas kalidii]MDH5835361.1 XRE family transcriptional regulator [Luteimonas kalidii]
MIQGHGWTPAETAHYSSIDPYRVENLLRGSISRFSLDALVDIAAKLGQQVRIRLEPR